ncbi:MAG: hypothetical protein J7L69_10340, partial [Desulfobulbaceae bacterium]|nr:hypothetical protein [Desulfobulbaceae bacterium]
MTDGNCDTKKQYHLTNDNGDGCHVDSAAFCQLGLAKSGTVDVTSVAIIVGKVVLFFGVTISIG